MKSPASRSGLATQGLFADGVTVEQKARQLSQFREKTVGLPLKVGGIS